MINSLKNQPAKILLASISATIFILIYNANNLIFGLTILFGIAVGLITLIFITLDPFKGLLLIIIINHFDDFLQLPMTTTAGRAIGILVAGGWFLKYLVRNKTNFFKFMELNSVLLVFILVMVLSSLLATYPAPSLKISFTIALLITMVFFIEDFVMDKKKLNIFILTIAISVGIASLVGIIQYQSLQSTNLEIGSVHKEQGEVTRFSGFEGNPNGYGAFLMSGIPMLIFLSLNSRNRYFMFISFLFFCTSLISLGLTISRTHIIGFCFFVFLYLYFNFRYKIFSKKQITALALIVVTISCVTFFFLFDIIKDRINVSYEKRSGILMKGVELWKANPIIGTGFGNFELLDINDGKFGDIAGRGGHDFISIYVVSTGFLGFMIFVYLCYKTLKHLRLASKRFQHINDKYMLSLCITIKSAFIALLLTFLGNAIIFSRIFWSYIAISIVLYKWSQMQASQQGRIKNNI